jgi:hypothetical protein
MEIENVAMSSEIIERIEIGNVARTESKTRSPAEITEAIGMENVAPIEITENIVVSDISEKKEHETIAPIEIIEGAAAPILTNEQNETAQDSESVQLLSSLVSSIILST